MATNLDIFNTPQPFIQTTGGKLVVHEETERQLRLLNKPCVVVAICGPYRTGKSYILNRLAGQSHGFDLGSTVQSKTKGIWIWAMEHPLDPARYLLLVDTEGLEDAEKSDERHDNQIFCLTILLSSMLIYNLPSKIDNYNIKKLRYVSEIAGSFKTHTSRINRSKDDSHFDWYFPIFVLALRDFTLTLAIDGREISSDEYLDHCLKNIPGDDQQAKVANKTRMKIRKYFRDRHCFTFETPCGRKKLQNLEMVPLEELNEDFQEEIAAFVKFVYQKAPSKQMEGSIVFNGSMLMGMVATLVKAMNTDKTPTLEEAVAEAVKEESEKVAKEVLTIYKNDMTQVKLPVNDAELQIAHMAAEAKSMEHFKGCDVLDPNTILYDRLRESMDAVNKRMKKDNKAKQGAVAKEREQEELLKDLKLQHEQQKKDMEAEMKKKAEEAKRAEEEHAEIMEKMRQEENKRFGGDDAPCSNERPDSFWGAIAKGVAEVATDVAKGITKGLGNAVGSVVGWFSSLF